MFFIEKSLDIRYFFEVGRCFISTRLYICLPLTAFLLHISRHAFISSSVLSGVGIVSCRLFSGLYAFLVSRSL